MFAGSRRIPCIDCRAGILFPNGEPIYILQDEKMGGNAPVTIMVAISETL
jgi:hypothetical protein